MHIFVEPRECKNTILCKECVLHQVMSGTSSQGDSESQYTYGVTNSHYYNKQIGELRDQVTHLETVNSKMVPDLEQYDTENYELK